MAKNTADAKWTGTLKEGEGRLALGGGAFEGPYTFKSRFEDGTETNPEEMIAAAEAGCFTMQLSNELHQADMAPESVSTTAEIELRNVDGAPTITTIALTTTVDAPGADEAKVRELAEAAKAGCIISRALAGVDEITLDLTVNS